ncbi:MAG: outer membrane lipoprotein-sorting protein [Calditrichales bacterium]|nr:MAG: outer membrane lipoprotein-sorting protein [Calditrichales bacterium]
MKNLVLSLIWLVPLLAQQPDGETILRRIDENMSAENRVLTSKMVVYGNRGSRTIESKSWSVGTTKSFTEYLSPAREKGTKMLKLEDQLWLYSPSTDRTIQISGHMLRQSVMGSDLSYEDMMDDSKLRENYHAAVIGTEEIDGNLCWILELTAKTNDSAYQLRKLWVDKQKYIPLRQELVAKSGKLLKKLDMSDVVNLDGRWFPKKLLFKDMLKTGQGTEFIIDEIDFNVTIPEYQFSKAALRK